MSKISEAIKALPEATKGPWSRCKCGQCQLVWSADGNILIHDTMNSEEFPVPDNKHGRANATIIAAAPEMATWIIKITDMLKRLRENYPLGSNPIIFAEIDEILQEIEK